MSTFSDQAARTRAMADQSWKIAESREMELRLLLAKLDCGMPFDDQDQQMLKFGLCVLLGEINLRLGLAELEEMPMS